MSDQLLIVYAYLDTLAANAQTAVDSLSENSSLMDLDFGEDEQVNEKYDDLHGRWDEHRGKLIEGMQAAADAFGAVSTSFSGLEDELVNSLNQGE